MFRFRPWSQPSWRRSLAALTLLLLGSWLFVGIYEEREWRELYIFLKHRPSVKLFFYAPMGEADRSSVPGHRGYLTPDQEREEELYVEFVEVHKGYKRSLFLAR